MTKCFGPSVKPSVGKELSTKVANMLLQKNFTPIRIELKLFRIDFCDPVQGIVFPLRLRPYGGTFTAVKFRLLSPSNNLSRKGYLFLNRFLL